jgi:hypothetical protein
MKNQTYQEAGVNYSHSDIPGFTKVEYSLQNLKTDKISKRTVWVENPKKINNLFMWWNRSDKWKVFSN